MIHKIYEEKQIDTKWKKGTKDPTKTKNEERKKKKVNREKKKR